MESKEEIGGATEGDWYGYHAMDGSGSFREENTERRICRCDSSMFGSGVESNAPKRKVFRAILAALPVVETRLEWRWRR